MVSVCMAVKNGARYIEEQIDSIVRQLGSGDELIVCDDHSTDSTLDIVRGFADPRIRIFSSGRHGITNTFEVAISRSNGDFIFLADQDDIWHPEKIATMLPYFRHHDVVVSDCSLVDEENNMIAESFFVINGSGKGLFRNLVRNSYMGCCMAFSRSILKKALPFPGNTAIHDFWIGMVGELHFKPMFLKKALVRHRIHGANASTSGKASTTPHIRRVSQRYQLVRNLIRSL